ncbi:MAG TPA: winged helix-turn-helix domain-containing protein [Acetobacteraceae bacterium]|nr:winged helix-turn-helix domain-containing protein [Acetobacteraceae bacterium]
MSDALFTFGPFQLVPAQRRLLRDGAPLRLGGHAFDILVALVENAGKTVGKDELIARAWADASADDNTLRVHVAALRRALSDDGTDARYVTAVPGRGYSFTATVRRVIAASTETPAQPPAPPASNLPTLLSPVIGRDDVIAILVDQLSQHRLLTILGPGGIGKTTVAVAVAGRASPAYRDGVWFVSLAPLSDPTLLPGSVAAALGFALSAADPVAALADRLRDKRALILLDNCEHVINAAAVLAETVLRVAPGVSILATSREPMRADGEWLHRLASLEWPSQAHGISAQDAMTFSAVRLFHQRVFASLDGFRIDDDNLAAVLTICRLLDGVPLALELAAVRVEALGVEGVAARLDDRFTLLSKGRRTALPRQQTLRATLDWSYELLPPGEKIILHRLAVFRGTFAVSAAAAVAGMDSIAFDDVCSAVANLVAKSLVVSQRTGSTTRYRLLDTTRAYALEKLQQNGEAGQVARRHAAYFLDVFRQAETEWETRLPSDWMAEYAAHLDNLRAAIDWAYAPHGDAAMAVALTAMAVPLWVQMSLVDECYRRVAQALARIEGLPATELMLLMKLYAALGGSLLYVKGPTQETEAAWTRTLALAETVGAPEYQMRALWGLWVHHMNRGEFGTALLLARRFLSHAQHHGAAEDLSIGTRMIGTSLHYRGDQTEARHHIEKMLAHYIEPPRRPPATRFRLDQKVVARVALSRILWIQGYPDQAWQMARATVDDAHALHQPVTLSFALAESGCPVAMFIGDIAAADQYISILLETSHRHALPIWQSWGHRFRGALLIRQGGVSAGVTLLRNSLDQPPEASFQPRFTWFLGRLAIGLARLGELPPAMQAIDEVLARSERNEDRWCLAESLRIKGDLLVQDDADTAAAEDCYRQALACAHEQGALSWELRAAISLLRLHENRDGPERAELAAIYRGFTEGFDTADLQEARRLLDASR